LKQCRVCKADVTELSTQDFVRNHIDCLAFDIPNLEAKFMERLEERIEKRFLEKSFWQEV